MLDENFLTEILGKEDLSVEDKIKQIIAEKEADTRGLIKKRDELLESEKKLKEKNSTLEASREEYNTKISALQEELKKASSEEHKKYYETQLADLTKKHTAEIEELTKDRDFYKESHLKALRDRAIEEGVKDLNFVSGLKDGFIARVLSMNEFKPEVIDGETKFLNKEHHTIAEAISSFALSNEGKAYIRADSTGGGARGSSTVNGDYTKTKQISSTQLDNMTPEQLMEFSKNGGVVVD